MRRRVGQGDRADDGVRISNYLVPDEPRIGIGRDGSCVRLGGGRHRIAIAKVLEIDEIPAVVLVQHPNWADQGELRGVARPTEILRN